MKIIKVTDNKDKQLTYQQLNKKLKQSLEVSNYHETINLSYAMIEDRLKTILDLLYIIENRNKKPYPHDNVDKIIRPVLKFDLKGEKKNVYKINNITTKLNIIKRILKSNTEDIFIRDCKVIIQNNIGIKEMLDWIKKVGNWCKIRNEIIHGAFNKNYKSLNINLEETAKTGYELSITIKKYANFIKNNKKQISVKNKWEVLNKISEYNVSIGMLDKLNGFHVDNNLIEIELYNLDLIQDGKFIKLTINNIIEIVKKTDKSKKDNIIIDFIKQILECENNAIYYLNYILNNKEQIDMGVIEKLNSIRPKIINNNFQFYLNYAKVFEKEIDNYGLEENQFIKVKL